MGYRLAGFDVVGVDIKPQRHYPFRFVESDALDYCRHRGHLFDVIHASPPCQAYSRATGWTSSKDQHPDLIEETRRVLQDTGRPYVIENVEGARPLMHEPLMICGTAIGLQIRRHRFFEIWPRLAIALPPCHHVVTDFMHDHGIGQREATYREAMECGWMSTKESRQAIPPAYTELIGRHIMRSLNAEGEGHGTI